MDAAKLVKDSFAPKGAEDWKKITFKRDPDGEPMEYSFQYDVASNQQIKEVVTKHMYNMIKNKQGGGDYIMYKEEGTFDKKFTLVASVIVGYREDTFQVNWTDTKTFEETGVKTAEVEKELRSEFAK